MSDQGQIQAQQAAMPDHPDPQLEAALFDAIRVTASKCAGSDDPREVEEFARAALALAQAAVILDPKLVAPQGVPADALHPPVPYIQKDKQAPTARTAGQGDAKPSVVNVAPPHVEVHVHGDGKVTKKVVRDESGQITHVHEERG
jgi:hypothetical protein